MRIYRKGWSSRVFSTRAFIATALFVFIFGAFKIIFPSILPNILYQIATPIVRGWQGTIDWGSGLFANFYSKQKLTNENAELSRLLGEAQEKLLSLDRLQSDFESLKAAYDRNDKTQEVLATVLLAPPMSPYDTIVIDIGVRNDIRTGALVRSVGGSVVGRVSEVFRDFSLVSLFSSPGTETSVRIGKDVAQGQAVGIGNGEFQIILPRELSVAVGDAVIFQSLSNYPIGVVQTVEYQEADFLQIVSFQSAINIRQLSYLLVEISTDPEKDNEE